MAPFAYFVINDSFVALAVVVVSSFVMGVAAKITDESEDRHIRRLLPYGWAFVYSLLGIFLATKFPLANLWLAAALASLALEKIDSRPHLLALIIFVAGIFALGPMGIDPLHFLIFLVFAAADEFEWKAAPRIVHHLAKHRLFLEFSALASDLLMGQLHYFGSILPFDAGYAITCYALGKKYPARRWTERKKR